MGTHRIVLTAVRREDTIQMQSWTSLILPVLQQVHLGTYVGLLG